MVRAQEEELINKKTSFFNEVFFNFIEVCGREVHAEPVDVSPRGGAKSQSVMVGIFLFPSFADEKQGLNGELPQEVEIEDMTTLEQLQLMQDLDEEEQSMIFKMIDSFLTKKKFKDFFNKMSPRFNSNA